MCSCFSSLQWCMYSYPSSFDGNYIYDCYFIPEWPIGCTVTLLYLSLYRWPTMKSKLCQYTELLIFDGCKFIFFHWSYSLVCLCMTLLHWLWCVCLEFLHIFFFCGCVWIANLWMNNCSFGLQNILMLYWSYLKWDSLRPIWSACNIFLRNCQWFVVHNHADPMGKAIVVKFFKAM